MEIKKRLALRDVELKISEKKGQFEGYASVFNSNDYVNDTILPGAFTDTLKNDDMPRMFFNHDSYNIPVGTWVSLKENEKGLYAIGEINLEHYLGPSVYSAMKREDITGLSIGFSLGPKDFTPKENGGRDIIKVKLHEISAVTFPAEPNAQIIAVKFEDMDSIRDLEKLLRDEANFSQKTAKAFLSRCKRILASDLLNAQKEIETLRSQLDNKLAFDSLLNTLNKLGN